MLRVVLNRLVNRPKRSWKRNKPVSDHSGVPRNRYSTIDIQLEAAGGKPFGTSEGGLS